MIVDALSAVVVLILGYNMTVSRLETGFTGFSETAFVKKFPVAGHDLTSYDVVNV